MMGRWGTTLINSVISLAYSACYLVSASIDPQSTTQHKLGKRENIGNFSYSSHKQRGLLFGRNFLIIMLL